MPRRLNSDAFFFFTRWIQPKGIVSKLDNKISSHKTTTHIYNDSIFSPFFFVHPPGQKHGLGLWEPSQLRREESMAGVVGVVVVRVMGTVRVEIPLVVGRYAFAVHGPEESQDEHDHPQHHAAQRESLQAALVGGQEGCGAPGHNEEGSDEDCSVVQGRHLPTGLQPVSELSAGLGPAGRCHSHVNSSTERGPPVHSDEDQRSTRFTRNPDETSPSKSHCLVSITSISISAETLPIIFSPCVYSLSSVPNCWFVAKLEGKYKRRMKMLKALMANVEQLCVYHQARWTRGRQSPLRNLYWRPTLPLMCPKGTTLA